MTRLVAFAFVWLILATPFIRAADLLPSWNAGPTKDNIIDFVRRVTNESSPDYVPPAERIATFDNDGCLWSEKPVYFQLLFAIDRIKQLAPEHPEWKTQQPFKAVLEGDQEAIPFCLLVHHTDADREWAYDRDSHVGRLDKTMDEAQQRGWTIADMARDWNTIYPP